MKISRQRNKQSKWNELLPMAILNDTDIMKNKSRGKNELT